MKTRSAGALLCLVGLLLGCRLTQAPLRRDVGSARDPCSQTWSSLAPELRHFEVRRDGKRTPEGTLGYREWADRLDRRRCVKPWTILVFVAADNDLAPYAYGDLHEMEAAWSEGVRASGSSNELDLLVQLDTPGRTGLRRLHMFQTDEPFRADLSKQELAQRTERDIGSPVVQLLPEPEGADSAQQLKEFLLWGIREYPAEHYMLIVWGHGQGWAPAQKPSPPAASTWLQPRQLSPVPVPAHSAALSDPFKGRGIRGGLAFNWTQRTFLDIPSLQRVLHEVSLSELQGAALDVFAADACLMQMIEVATELSGDARFLVGSTQVQDFVGLPYRELLYQMNTGRYRTRWPQAVGADPAYLLARLIPSLYQDVLSGKSASRRWLSAEARRTATMSAISTAELRTQLLPALVETAEQLTAYTAQGPLPRAEVRFVIENSQSFLGGAQDIGALLGSLDLLLKEEEHIKGELTPVGQHLSQQLARTRSALLRTVLEYAYGTDYQSEEQQLHLLGFRAFSVWLPPSPQEYEARIADFLPSRFYRHGARAESPHGAWPRWLASLYPSRP